MFFLVSGATASGKSTIARRLSARMLDVQCHDSDEKPAVNEYTRCQQLEEWVQLALATKESGKDLLLATQSPLGELLACPSAPKLDAIAACLLDCSDKVRVTRMRARGIDPRWKPNQDTVNWAAWHRMHAWDPQWEQHVIDGNGPATHSYDRWKKWEQTDGRWRVNVIDTTNVDVEHTLVSIAEWITAERRRVPLLSSTSHWWE